MKVLRVFSRSRRPFWKTQSTELILEHLKPGSMFYFSISTVSTDCTFRTLRWRHTGRDGVLNHQPHDCLLNLLFRRRSKETPKLRVTGLCVGNSPGTGQFPAQRASNAENVSIWWRHNEIRDAIMIMGCHRSGKVSFYILPHGESIFIIT